MKTLKKKASQNVLGKSDEKKSKDKDKYDLITNYENEKKRAVIRAKKSE